MISEQRPDLDIAIIGMAGRFPGAESVERFWDNLRDGVESISTFTEDELRSRGVEEVVFKRPDFVRAAPELQDVDLFDAHFFGYSSTEAAWLDPQQRVFLECACEALDSAGCDPASFDGLIGVFAGASLSSYLLYNLLPALNGPHSEDAFSAMIGNDKDFLSTRVSYKLNLKGPSMTLQTGCSTSLVAVHAAVQSLLSYQCDLALAGGVSIQTPQRTGYIWQDGGLLSPDGHCRAFDAAAAGTLFGSGCGIVTLKRLGDALASRDCIRAVIKGSAINNDGASKLGFTAPSVDGQAEVIVAAQAVAGVTPDSIAYVECHGTGTPLGDPIEVLALTKAFAAAPRSNCWIGSVKTNIGHLDAAAGVAGLIKAALALENRAIPPSLHFLNPNPRIDFAATPFQVAAGMAEWPAGSYPRRAGVSSFGIGGTNAHVVLEEAPEPRASSPSRNHQLILLSARSEPALDAATQNLGSFLAQSSLAQSSLAQSSLAQSSAPLADVAWSAQTGRKAFEHRRALVCSEVKEASRTLTGLDPARLITGVCESTARPVAFLFPGGGTQYAGMGRGLYAAEPAFREEIDRAAELLRPLVGFDIRLALYPDASRLDQATAQMRKPWMGLPSLLITEYAVARLWISFGIQPSALIGHSLGEIAAACIAGVFTLEDALRLVVERSRLLDEIRDGAMLSVAATPDELDEIIPATVSIAAVNGPAQCAIAGPERAIEAFGARLDRAGYEWRRIPIETASHSALVEPILEPFRELVSNIALSPPRIPFISNVTGDWVRPEEVVQPDHWVAHLRQTVQFSKGIQTLLALPEYALLEVGPGRTLSSLARNMAPKKQERAIVASMRHPQEPLDDQAALLTALGKLWVTGVRMDAKRYWQREQRSKVPLPPYPFERQRYWVDPPAPAIRRSVKGKIADVGQWFHVPAWTTASTGVADDADRKRCWLVFRGRSEVDDLLAAKLNGPVIQVYAGRELSRTGENQWELPVNEAEAYRTLLRILRDEGACPTEVLHLWGQPRICERSENEETWRQIGVQSLTWLGRALGEEAEGALVNLRILSSEAFGIESRDSAQPLKAALLAACRGLPQEVDGLRCQLIDLDPEGTGAYLDLLLGELHSVIQERVIAYRGARRWRLGFQALPIPADAPRRRDLRHRGVYLITGGFGAVGLHLARFLAREYGGRLVLVTRTPLPDRSGWAGWISRHGREDHISKRITAIEGLEHLGGEVLPIAADAGDDGSFRQAVAQALARFGAIHGIIHAAGLSGDRAVKLIDDVSAQDFDRQMEGKARGAQVLAAIAADLRPDFVLLMSSMASVIGGLGLLPYAAANAYLDATAEKQGEHRSTCWISANWDGWLTDERPTLSETFSTGIQANAMSPQEGLEAFSRLVQCAPSGQVIVSTTDLSERTRIWIEGEGKQPTAPGSLQTVHLRPAVSSPFQQPESEYERVIAELWRELLGLDAVGIHDNFFELGGNSLTGMRMISRLRQMLGLEIPMLALFQGPTVAALALVVRDRAPAATSNQDARARGERRSQRRRKLAAAVGEASRS